MNEIRSVQPLDAIGVFTYRSVDETLRHGGSRAWTLGRSFERKNRNIRFCILVRNAEHPHSSPQNPEAHRSAFLIGHISGVSLMPNQEQKPARKWRYQIDLSEYALIDIPEVWKRWQRPKFLSTAELGIDVNGLSFKPIPIGGI